jgi:hypothetical protein
VATSSTSAPLGLLVESRTPRLRVALGVKVERRSTRPIDGINQGNMANSLSVEAGMGLRLWRGANLGPNYERVVAKPGGEPDSQTVRFTFRQLW